MARRRQARGGRLDGDDRPATSHGPVVGTVPSAIGDPRGRRPVSLPSRRRSGRCRLPDGLRPPPARLGGRQVPRRRSVAVRLVLRTGIPLDYDPPLTFALRERPEPAAHLGDRDGVLRRRTRRGDDLRAARRRRAVHAAQRGDRVRARDGLRAGARDVLVHVRLLERALVPLVVASQTIPIIAIAPIIVFGLKADWFGVAIVSTLPDVLPGHDRGDPRAALVDPRALELMRSYAASRGAILRSCASRPPAVPVHGLQDRGPAASSARSSASCRRHPGRPGAPDHHGHAVLLAERREPVGRDRGRRRSSGSASTCCVVAVERVRPAPRASPGWSGRMTAEPATGEPTAPARSSRSRASPRSSTPAARAPAGVEALRRHRPVDRGRRVRLADRAVGLRQVDAPAHRRRPHAPTTGR